MNALLAVSLALLFWIVPGGRQAQALDSCPDGILNSVVRTLEARYFDREFVVGEVQKLAMTFRRQAAARACTEKEQRLVAFEFISRIPASHLALISRATYENLMNDLSGRPRPTLGLELVALEGGYFTRNILDGGPETCLGPHPSGTFNPPEWVKGRR